jgi:hypothetical protein
MRNQTPLDVHQTSLHHDISTLELVMGLSILGRQESEINTPAGIYQGEVSIDAWDLHGYVADQLHSCE